MVLHWFRQSEPSRRHYPAGGRGLAAPEHVGCRRFHWGNNLSTRRLLASHSLQFASQKLIMIKKQNFIIRRHKIPLLYSMVKPRQFLPKNDCLGLIVRLRLGAGLWHRPVR
jgi:hypothetical protein